MKKYLFAIVLVLVFAVAAYGESVTASIGGAGNYTSSISPYSYEGPFQGKLALSIYGTWSGIVTLQRSFDEGSNWRDADTFTANTEKIIEDGTPGIDYRVGIKSGDYTSGTANVGLYK